MEDRIWPWNAGSDNASVLLGNGGGTFQTARNFQTGSFPRSVALADFKSLASRLAIPSQRC